MTDNKIVHIGDNTIIITTSTIGALRCGNWNNPPEYPIIDIIDFDIMGKGIFKDRTLRMTKKRRDAFWDAHYEEIWEQI